MTRGGAPGALPYENCAIYLSFPSFLGQKCYEYFDLLILLLSLYVPSILETSKIGSYSNGTFTTVVPNHVKTQNEHQE